MNTPSHTYHGLWRRSDTRQLEHRQLEPWIELAQVLERGKFDLIFFADLIGLMGEYGGGHDFFIREGLSVPVHDAGAVISGLAVSTTDLGLVFTSSIIQDHPFAFARRISTLDHLSRGRVGWNVVTTAHENAARNLGFDQLIEHDERYRWAEEYMEVVYKLWEGSWEDGALLEDRVNGVYADPERIHRINHVGSRYKVEGPHLVSPSPQRTPLLAQAGTSAAGRAFAARHAEAVFVSAVNPHDARKAIDDLRSLARAAGRRGEDLKALVGLTFVVGSTEEEARRKADDLDASLNLEAQLAQQIGAMGVDLAGLPMDTRLRDLPMDQVQGIRGMLQSVIESVPEGTDATLAHLARKSLDNRLVGTPEQIADALEQWQDAGADGVLIRTMLMPGTYSDFVDHVIPVLQERGLAQREYAPGTLREKVYGEGPRLPDRHVASTYRTMFTASLPAAGS